MKDKDSKKTDFQEKNLRKANDIDFFVGQRILMRRNLLGWDQKKLADKLGISFQQLQKYEQGKNRISASRLWDISRALGVPIDFFFYDVEESPKEKILYKKETITLVSSFYKIPNRDIASHIFTVAKDLAKFKSFKKS